MKKYAIAATCLLVLVMSVGAAQPLPSMPGGMPPDQGMWTPPPQPEPASPLDEAFDEPPMNLGDFSPMDVAEAPPQSEPPNPVGAASMPGMAGQMRSMRQQRPLANLTIEQQRKMADQRIKFIKDVGGLMADMAVKKAELSSLWLDDDPNEDKIIAKAKEIEQIRAQLQEKRLRNRVAMLKILTPEQRKQMPMRTGGMMRGMGGQQRMRRGWNQ
jgi:Spy/CpxP family protein refolding chaperone